MLTDIILCFHALSTPLASYCPYFHPLAIIIMIADKIKGIDCSVIIASFARTKHLGCLIGSGADPGQL